jgi:hypothetical protein
MSDERREYFRIADEIALDYCLLTQQEMEQLQEKIQSDLPDRFTAASSFAATSRRMAHVLHKAQNESPEMARCLQLLDQKLNNLAQLFLADEFDIANQPQQQVNISAGGLAFRARNDIPTGSLLELRMVLFPSLVGILAGGRVVHNERVQDGNLRLPWHVAVNYECMRESDRELLVRHIMSKETRQLRKNRT